MSYSLKSIAVFFDSSDEGLHILEIAVRLADEQDAHLIGLIAASYGDSYSAGTFAKGDAIREVIQRKQSALALRLLHAGQALAKVSDKYGIASEFRVIPASESGGESALHALYCGLLLVSHPNMNGTPIGWSLPQMLQRIGISVLVVPENWSGNVLGQRITVAWNASRQARRALIDAHPLLAHAREVQLLIVDSEEHPGLHGEEPSADTAAYLARHSVNVVLQRISSQGNAVADVIAAEATNNHSDLIVSGAWSHSRFTEAMLGGVTRTLLNNVPHPLFISH